MNHSQLREFLYDRIKSLPTLPAVLPRVLTLTQDDNAGPGRLVEAISQDPALTAKVLRVANSAYYSFSRAIATLEHAVPLIGLNTVRSLALSIGVMDNLKIRTPLPGFSLESLWTHSLAVAMALEKLAQKLDLDTHYLFTLGLLHDVGKIVLVRYFSDRFAACLERLEGRPYSEVWRIERQEMGFDHAEVGGILLAQWRFPDLLVKPIQAHHADKPLPKASRVDWALLRVADVMSHRAGLVPVNGPAPDYPGDLLEYLEVKPQAVQELESGLAGQAERINALYSAMS